MVGGYSRLMAKAVVEWSDGERQTLVLRGDPPAGKSLIETDRDTEFALLQALTADTAIALPGVRYYDATGEHLGTKCIVIDFVEGQSLQTLISGTDVESATAAHRNDFVDTLAKLADQAGVALPTLAVAWTLRNPVITSPIIGASKVEQLDATLAAVDYEIDDDLYEQLNAVTTPYRRGDAPR